MRKKMTRWYETVLSALLTMLGFSSCENVSHNVVCEYGCPNVEYQVKGTVTDAASGKPVEGIQAKVAAVERTDEGVEVYGMDSLTTSKDGTFAFPLMNDMNIDGLRTSLILEDVDGMENGGVYASDTIELKSLPREQVKEGDGKWFGGGFELKAERSLKKVK